MSQRTQCGRRFAGRAGVCRRVVAGRTTIDCGRDRWLQPSSTGRSLASTKSALTPESIRIFRCTLDGRLWINRHVGSARLQDAEDRGDGPDRLPHHHADPGAFLDVIGLQEGSESVRGVIKLRIGDRATVRIDDGDAIRRCRDARLEVRGQVMADADHDPPMTSR